jgi:hypothetical protein
LADVLKGNDKYLEKCIMNGIVRIVGAGIFLQLNNLKVHTILDKPFSKCFGITKGKVEKLAKEVLINIQKLMNLLRLWKLGIMAIDLAVI